MCVWDVPDAEVSALGRRLAQEAAVTLVLSPSAACRRLAVQPLLHDPRQRTREVLVARTISCRAPRPRPAIRTPCCSAAGASKQTGIATSTPLVISPSV